MCFRGSSGRSLFRLRHRNLLGTISYPSSTPSLSLWNKTQRDLTPLTPGMLIVTSTALRGRSIDWFEYIPIPRLPFFTRDMRASSICPITLNCDVHNPYALLIWLLYTCLFSSFNHFLLILVAVTGSTLHQESRASLVWSKMK